LFRTIVVRGILGLTPRHPLPASCQSGATAITRISQLIDRLPPQWTIAAIVAINDRNHEIPPPQEAWKRIVKSLGWRVGQVLLHFSQVTVKFATTLLMAPSLRTLDIKHEDFILDAVDIVLSPENLANTLLEFRRTLSRMWRLRWDNEHKEALWRLALDGFPAFPMHRAQQLYDTARAAMFALSAKLDKLKLFAPDVRMRCFDTQVRAILLYGCQAWGPFIC